MNRTERKRRKLRARRLAGTLPEVQRACVLANMALRMSGELDAQVRRLTR